MNDSIPVDLKETANLTTRLDRMPLTRTNILISSLLLTVWMCEAFDMGVMSIMLVFVKDLWQLTPTDQSLLGISATVGVAIGAGFAGRLMDLYGRKKVLIIGVAYKRDTDDTRESPALDIIQLLVEKGAEVVYHDPLVSSLHHEGRAQESAPLDADLLANADAVVIVTDHSDIDYDLIRESGRPVLDTRNVLKRPATAEAN